MSYSFSHKKIIMNLQEVEQFLQKQQNTLKKNVSKELDERNKLFYDSRTVCSLKCYSFNP